MYVKLAVGFLALFGVILGATLQYFFTRHIENQKHSRELKAKPYMDYLTSVADQAQFSGKLGSKEHKALYAKTADAKSRICLYGSSTVVSAFSRFERLGAKMATPEQRASFTNMVSLMRLDSGNKEKADGRELQDILLGIR